MHQLSVVQLHVSVPSAQGCCEASFEESIAYWRPEASVAAT